MTIKAAVKKVTTTLKKEKAYYDAYKSTIALSFIDECNHRGVKISKIELHEVANAAADRFLKLWME